jgi:hypothetical protein
MLEQFSWERMAQQVNDNENGVGILENHPSLPEF